MPAPVTAPGAHLRQAVADTTDTALLQIVGLLDCLAYRPGELQGILSDALPRLAVLRPARPLRFSRLLFLPLDGVIVPGDSWRPGQCTLPRTALQPIAESLRTAMGEKAAEAMDIALAGRTAANADNVATLGTVLWTLAAELAPRMRAPAENTLSERDFRELVAICAGVWQHGEALWRVLRHAPDDPPRHLVERLLHDAEGDTVTLLALLKTMMHGVARPGTLASMASDCSPAIATLAGQAVDDWIEASVRNDESANPVRLVGRAKWFATAVDDLEATGWLADPARRRRVRAAPPGPMRQQDNAALPDHRAAAVVPTPCAPEHDRAESFYATLRRRLFGAEEDAKIVRKRLQDINDQDRKRR